MDKHNKTRIFRDLIGIVVKAAMKKTIVVRVDTMKEHTKYGKYFRVSKKYYVHDEKGLAKVGEKVKFRECRPLSKTKRWYLVEVIK
jgi:small subunit ribosomal protein S17